MFKNCHYTTFRKKTAHTHMHTCIHIHTRREFNCVNVCVYEYVCIYTHTYIDIHMCKYVFVCMYSRCTHVQSDADVQVHIYTYVETYWMVNVRINPQKAHVQEQLVSS